MAGIVYLSCNNLLKNSLGKPQKKYFLNLQGPGPFVKRKDPGGGGITERNSLSQKETEMMSIAERNSLSTKRI